MDYKVKFRSIVIVIWLVLWVNFIARDLYRKGYLDDYKVLVKCNSEEKRAYTYGEDFYEFLRFVKKQIPPGAYYEFAGIEELSLAWRRAIYYLYPCLKKENGDYLLVYGIPGFKKDGFGIYASLNKNNFILGRE